jgi:hypothetical protein
MDNSISNILQFGDFIPLSVSIDNSIKQDLKGWDNKFSKYNPRSNNPRQGLCVLNERGETGPGPALDSLKQYNNEHGTNWGETDFNLSTEIYNESVALQSLLDNIKHWCVRTHFIKLQPGGYFPPHRDHTKGVQNTFRLIIPIQNCNAPFCRFMLEDATLNFEHTKMYFINTTKQHSLFNASPKRDSMWLIINALLCKESIDWVTDNLDAK